VADVEQAYADDRIPPEYSELEEFRAGLAEALAAAPDDGRRFEREHVGYLEDVLVELEPFNFAPPGEKSTASLAGSRQHWDYDPFPFHNSVDRWAPAHNPMRHVGRNDPCPCGSGRKYKKCCGAAA